MIAPFVVAFLQVVPQPPATPRTAPDSTRPRLAPVVVTAERPRAAPPPVAVTTVAPEALRRAAGATAYDAVRRAAGLEVHEQGQGPGFTSNVVLRGFNSDHSADVLLTVDGVPINSPIHGHVEGFSDWNILLPAAVSSFRVVHGGASPLYGDFSLAGVAEIFTAADAVGAAHAVRSSSFGDVGYTGRTGLRRATWGALAAVDARRDQGWQPNGAASLGNVLLRGWRTAWGGRLEGGVQAYTSRWRSPGFVSISRYNLGRFDEAVDTTDGGWSQRLIAHARYARPLGARTQLEATAWGQTSAYRMRLNLPGQALALRQAEERDERTGAGGRVQVVRSLLRGEGVVGVEGRADVADYGFDATLGGSFVTREHAYDARFASGAAFARWRTLIASRLLVDVGGRLDALSYRSFDLLRPNTGWRQGTQLIPTPKLGASWFAREGLVVRSSFSRGFRGAPGVIADPTRAPFLAWASELGTTWERGALSVDAALFRMDVDNERIFNPLSLAVSSAGRSRRQGIDVRTGWHIGRATSLRAAVTVNDARFLGRADGDTTVAPPSPDFHDHAVPMRPGDRVPGVARWTGSIGAETRVRGVDLRTHWRLLGPFVPISEPGVQTRTASVLDLGVAAPIGRVVVDVAIQNLLDLRYVENRASGFITPGVPRVLRLTLSTPGF